MRLADHLRNIVQQIHAVDAEYLDIRLHFSCRRIRRPRCLHPAAHFRRIVLHQCLLIFPALLLVNRNAVTHCRKADDFLALQRRAAARELYFDILNAVHDNARDALDRMPHLRQ